MTEPGGVIEVELLGTPRVRLDGRNITAGQWPRRAQELVALLALADRRRLTRDRVVHQLWPRLGGQAGAANLRKAAHHARRALGAQDAVVLRGGTVELFPGRVVVTDVETFLRRANEALKSDDAERCAEVAATCAGELLPDARYEDWTLDARHRVRAALVALLRGAGEHERLMDVEPTDEAACRELMRAALDAGQRHTAIRWYERLRLALIRELGVRPDAETRALYDRCTRGVRLGESAFVGRELELAEAMGELGRVAAGETAAVVVRGTIGIGKSALCREVVRRAADDGWEVLMTAGTAASPPYGAIASAVEQMLVGGRASLQALPERTRSVLAELSPLAEPAPGLGAPLTRHQVIAALRRALALGGERPTLLCVEDGHLVDEATADVLHQLVAAGAGSPFVVLLACRAEWMRTSLPLGIARLQRSEQSCLIELGPLAGHEVAQLVQATDRATGGPPHEVVQRIVRTAEGSPFFALELARASSSAASGGALPRTVREAITDRFVGFDALALDMLAKLAVVDGELDLESVLALTGLTDDQAYRLLDEALAAGVLVVAGTRYRFRHELVRQSLTGSLPPHRRVALHREAARRLEATGGTPELIAHHLVSGGRAVEAVPWLEAAARHAVALGAFADALVQVERLLVQAPGHHDGLRLRAEILDALGDGRAPEAYATAAAIIGEPEAQDLTARRALAQLKASEPVSALATLAGCTPRTVVGRLAEALTLSAAAAIGVFADADTAATKAGEARALALELGDPGAILDATWAHALAAHAKGELPSRLRDYLRTTSTLPELATRVFDGQLCVTERMLHGGLPNDEIIAFADGLAAEAERLGAARGHAFALTLRGEAGFLAGRLEQADADLAAGARLHGEIGAVAGEALSLLGRAQVATSRGRPEHARTYLADALLLARESEVGHHTLDRVYGAMIEAAPDPATGVELVAEAETAIVGPAETCPTCRIAFIVPAAVAAARAGDLDRARRYAADCETALQVIALPPAWHAAGAEVRGWVAWTEGHDEGARGHFRAAAEGFATWGQPLDSARCTALAGG